MSPTILVVDDNKELVALLTSLFEEAGYVVRCPKAYPRYTVPSSRASVQGNFDGEVVMTDPG